MLGFTAAAHNKTSPGDGTLDPIDELINGMYKNMGGKDSDAAMAAKISSILAAVATDAFTKLGGPKLWEGAVFYAQCAAGAACALAGAYAAGLPLMFKVGGYIVRSIGELVKLIGSGVLGAGKIVIETTARGIKAIGNGAIKGVQAVGTGIANTGI